MSRNYANILTAIWRNDEFRALEVGAQHMYLMLTSQPDISAAGVLPLSVKRWSNHSAGATVASVMGWLNQLQAHKFIVFDIETEELLVRSFIRWDGGHTNPKRRPVIQKASQDVESSVIRRSLARELKRLGLPDWLPDSHADSLSDPHSDDSLSSQANSLSDSVSPSEGVVVTKALVVGTATHNPQTAVPPPSSGGAGGTVARKPAASRGHRVPDDFAVAREMRIWAAAKTPGIDIDSHTEAFLDHFRSLPGARALKTDWIATWRNWMRRAADQFGRPNNVVALRQRSTTDERVQGWLNLEIGTQEALPS